MRLILIASSALVAGAAVTIAVSSFTNLSSNETFAPHPTHNDKSDPKVGDVLPLVENLKLDPAVGAQHFVLFVGSCTSCSLKHIQVSKIPVAAFRDVKLVVFAVQRAIPKEFKQISRNLRVVWDPSGDIYKAWNADFQPRWYILSSDGKLIDCQRSIAADRYGLAK